MATPNLAIFKYQHADRVAPAWASWAVWLGTLALLALGVHWDNGFVIFLGIAGAIGGASLFPKKRIALGPRYMLCGNTLIYYGNVQRMVLTPGRELVLQWGDNSIFKLERERFPTNARKAPKIEKNKTLKFEKVSGRIIEKVLQAAPKTELVRRKAKP